MTEQEIFEIIIHAGNAKAAAYEGLRLAQTGDSDAATGQMSIAEAELALAHKVQTELIQRQVRGESDVVTLLAVHAQDHLMSAISERDLIDNMIKLHKTVDGLTRRLEALECRESG